MRNTSQPGVVYVIEDAATCGQLPTVAATGNVQTLRGKPFQKGQSGNPAGRKPGSRNKITELFISAMRDDFAAHGAEAIAALRERDPAQYLAAVRSMVPTKLIEEHEAKIIEHDAMNDAEWAEAMDNAAAVNPLRRKRAMDMVLCGAASTVAEAMRMLGADL